MAFLRNSLVTLCGIGFVGAACMAGPSLPEGLGEVSRPGEPRAEERERDLLDRLSLDLHGFVEGRGGVRTQRDPREKDASIGEIRFQMEAHRFAPRWTAELVADLIADAVQCEEDVDLDDGRGWLDLRRANISFMATDFLDIKVGRQILTWGTGDLLFINDLFPKDWNSFFIGRDVEYLKAPSDSIKGSIYTDWVNLDLVYSPRFRPDRFIDGSRISYWNEGLGRRTGRDVPVEPDVPEDWFAEDEWAFRLFRTLAGYELAAYAYSGYWKSPAGTNPTTGEATFPQLNAYGASLRGNLSKGIAHAEMGMYDSKEDREGSNPWIRNSELRLLLGYEQEVARDFTVGAQYYLERMLDYGAYIASHPSGINMADQDRHWVTLRLTRLLLSQNLNLSLFTFYSPSDQDAYLRPSARYKIDDHWIVEVGGNLFTGKDDHTFFAQFEKNSNLYASIRYSF